MLDYSELTVVKNTDGTSTALGYPINSFLLQNNKPLFVGGGADIAVPAGLVCMTQTICRRVSEADDAYDTYADDAYAHDTYTEDEIVPESLYDKLMLLAETKPSKKMTKRKQPGKKNKTHKRK